MILGIIQARMGSTRLPGKVLKKISGKPMMLYLYERFKKAKLVDKVVIATANDEINKPIIEFAKENGIDYYAGDENDLVDRLYQTAIKFGADAIVRITADCPLVDPDEVDRVIKIFLDGNFDQVSNNFSPTLPHGLDVEVIKVSAMKKVWENIKEAFWRELAFAYIYEHPEEFKIKNADYHEDLSHHRWTVDYPEDFEFVSQVFEKLAGDVSMLELLEFVKKNPEIAEINKMHNTGNKAYHDELAKKGVKSKRKRVSH